MSDTWAAPPVERTDPGRQLGERAAMESWLDFHRATLLMKCAGLSAEQLRERAVPPSTLSLLGLVRHMTEVERGWFRIRGGGQAIGYVFSYETDNDADFNDTDDADAAETLDAFRAEIEECKAAVRGKHLDDVIPSGDKDPRPPMNLRWIYLHMIEEYARHNGHADFLRERIDGSTGD
ncbi:MAG: DinB family protein [Actinomycetota bacterium]